MNKPTDPRIKRKPGATSTDDKKSQRYRDLENAAQTQLTNEGKVPVRVDHRTVILVPASQRSMYEKKYRIAQARKPENQEKVEYLKSRGWILRDDGIWRHRENFMYREFEYALSESGYYERNRVSHKP